MATKGKRPMRALTPGDKIEAIQRVNDGESKASVARDIGVPESTLRGWCKNEDKLRYMTSTLSSPDTDKSNDGEPLEKRARTESPIAPQSPSPNGLDLTTPTTTAIHVPIQSTPPIEAPVELTTRRAQPSPPTQHTARDRRADPGASVSMSAISPLSGLAHLPGLSHSHLGISFNEIATNLTLLAQLNPSLNTLSAQPASRALRSIRSPKPAHNGLLLNESKHRSKSHHMSDHYRTNGSKSSHHSTASSTSQPVDDTLWYWLKTQQAMLDLSAQTTAAHPLQLGKTVDPTIPPKPVVPTPSVNPHIDYNRNTWLWQYYKQFGGAMPLPDDKLKSAAQVPKEKSSENILYSQLIKGKEEKEERKPTSPIQHHHNNEVRECREISHEDSRVPELAPSPGIGAENKEPIVEKHYETGRSQTKARTVLDNLLFNNTNSSGREMGESMISNGEWSESGAGEALEHGEKFLAWLEASGDPSVTRMHVHQLRALLHNLRARRVSAPAPAPATHLTAPQPTLASDHTARRK